MSEEVNSTNGANEAEALSVALQRFLGLSSLADQIKGLVNSPAISNTLKSAVENGVKSAVEGLFYGLQGAVEAVQAATEEGISSLQTEMAAMKEEITALKHALNFSSVEESLRNLEAAVAGLSGMDVHASIKEALVEVMSDEDVKVDIASLVTSGIQGVLADEDYFALVVQALGDGMVKLVKQSVGDEDVSTRVKHGVLELVKSEAFKGAFADAVFHGTQRMTSDGEAQKSVAAVGNLIIGSQATNNLVKSTVETAARRQREFFQSPEFAEVMDGLAAKIIGALQETFNIILSEQVQELRKVKLTMSVDG